MDLIELVLNLLWGSSATPRPGPRVLYETPSGALAPAAQKRVAGTDRGRDRQLNHA